MSESDPTTRPTLETLLEMMREVRDEMRAGFVSVNERLDRVETRLASIERKIKVLNEDVLSVRADLSGMDARVSKLEESQA